MSDLKRLLRSLSVSRAAVSGTAVSVVVTGLTNLMVPVALQVSAGTRALGAFAVVTAVFTVALTMQRALCTQLVLPGGLSRADLNRLLLACGALCLLSVLWGLAACLSLPSATGLVWMVLLFPAAQLQDLVRFWCFSRHSAGLAAASDVTWFATSVAILGALVLNSHLTPGRIAAAWGVGAVVALWPMFVRRARPAASVAHAAALRPTPWRALLVEAAMIPAAGQALMIGLVRTSGIETVGELRLAQVLLSANALALSTAMAFLVPRLDLRSAAAVARASRLIGLTLLALGAAVTAATALDPFGFLQRLHTAPTASLVATVGVLAVSGALSGVSGIRLVRIRRTVPVAQWLPRRAVAAYSEPTAGLLLSLPLGAVGAACGQLVNQALLVVLLSKASRSEPASAESLQDAAAEPVDHVSY
jgi:hypothetical protein